ncbi:GerAB/ArcD/ProY family transporter [Tumebacillus permanentifrigoris]|uniref:Spore germination protein (Amino acid permease) n=1 Tax=Tumebacillus permanentifrigoris TaxID=378543 RepID=A0A316D7Y1_9BACL|nr:endospore germination permease [Tumebacillus permanentifrigoris]PWK12849.1 spore germination protein (amino acid permease) [Tumebacillus permanentifrigoris]
MIKTGHLGRREMLALTVVASVADVSLFYPQQLVMRGASAGWMIPVFSMLVAFAVWALVAPVLVREEKQDLITLCEKSLGSFATRAICVVIALYMIADLSTFTRTFTEAVVTTVLPRSPISFIAVPFFLVCMYYAKKGIEGISRVSLVLWSWLAIGMLALLILNWNWMRPEQAMPLWGNGIGPLLSGAGLFTSVFLNILVIALFSSRMRKGSDVRAIGYWSIGIIGVTYLLVTLVFLMCFSPEAAMRSPFPLYQLGRLIYIGRFIQRLEAAFVFIWVVMAVIKVSMAVMIATYLFATVFRMPVYRPLVAAVAIIVYDLSFYPRSFVETISYNNKYIVTWGWAVTMGIPLVVTLAVRVRKRREVRGDEELDPQENAS